MDDITRRFTLYLRERFSDPRVAETMYTDGETVREWLAQLPQDERRQEIAKFAASYGVDHLTLIRIADESDDGGLYLIVDLLLEELRHHPRVTVLD